MNMFRFILVIMFLYFPINANWTLKHPWPNIKAIKDAVVLDNNTIIAVGEDGTIIKTHNGGDYWKREDVSPLCKLNSISFWDSLNGIICQDTNYLYTTDDGGVTWTHDENVFFNNSNSSENLYLLNKTDGWMTANKTILLSSKNSGATWDSIYTFAEEITLLKFTDEKRGVAISIHKDSTNYSNVYMTFDGGMNWEKKLSSIKPDINSISSVDSNSYALIGINYYGYNIPYPHPFVIVTNDCWQSHDTIMFENDAIYAIFNGQMISKDSVSVINDSYKHFYGIQNDSGWNAEVTTNNLPEIKQKQIKGGLGVIINENGNLIYTRNGGKNWTSLNNGSSGSCTLTKITFKNSKLGWASGDESQPLTSQPPKGVIFKTLDGGERWHKISHKFSRSVVDIEFSNKDIGWVIFGDGNNLCYLNKSTDGGLSWIPAPKNSDILDSVKFRVIEFISEDIGFLVGKHKIIKTIDGGETWALQNIHCNNTDFIIKDIKMVSPMSGCIIGEDGLLLKTSDGGANWYQLELNTANDFNSITFVNENDGWVATGNQIFRTSDGGISWNEISIVDPVSFRKIVFLNQKQGVAINKNISYITNDGGYSWIKDKYEIGNTLYGIGVSDSHNVWVTGENNGIYNRIIEQTVDVNQNFKVLFSDYQSNIRLKNLTSTIQMELSIKRHQKVSLSFYTLNGKQLPINKYSKYLNKGNHILSFSKSSFPKGIFIARIKLGTSKYSKQIIID